MDTHTVIWNYQDEIVKIYRQEGLDCLCGIDLSYELNGKNILEWYHNATHRNGNKLSLGTRYFDLQTDLFMCSDEMMYFTAHLYLYKPYINNPLHDSAVFNGKEIFFHNQNIEAKRYNMFADIVGQKTYNYWDRIGDLIATFFPGEFKENAIYFSNSLNFIPQNLKTSENYIWLRDFIENEYKELNRKRIQIVHYETTSTEHFKKFLRSTQDKASIQKLQALRESLPDYYKNHIKLSLLGFEKTLNLLEELNNQSI